MHDGYCRAELIAHLCASLGDMNEPQIEQAVKLLLDLVKDTLGEGNRVEVRGFGSFCLHVRSPRTARNPKTGELVAVTAKPVPHFKPSKLLKELLNSPPSG